MTLQEVFNDKTPIAERSTQTLKTQLAVIRAAKCWRGDYYAIDREVQKRTTRQWVLEDVFGHTFSGSAQ
jgi:hypothetical protein